MIEHSTYLWGGGSAPRPIFRLTVGGVWDCFFTTI